MHNIRDKRASYVIERAIPAFWQEAALGAMQALITAQPPSNEQLSNDGALSQYARDIARTAFLVADEMASQHGPCISTELNDGSWRSQHKQEDETNG